ncbi:GNAT family N-acetyltransferase [Sandarakinorhabdus sp.]|uniref:GNAT family N-acetyltransferase n=1 Tax=Sandarakinorhabdus sp. TaxID=1916663 RepID=UPI00333EBCBC
MALILQSDRLVLRAHRHGDFERLAAMWSHPGVVLHFGGKPFSREDSWNRLLRYAGNWQLLGYGMWAVTRPGDDVHLGDVGFLHGERTGVPAFGCPEAAWAFHPDVQGQGFGGEAVACVLAWADKQAATAADPRFDRTAAMINPANAASIAVARRCGFSIFGDARYADHPVGLWERGAPT